jgi:hypothetical protein
MVTVGVTQEPRPVTLEDRSALGTIERVPGCEGLVVDVDAIWAEVDRLLA